MFVKPITLGMASDASFQAHYDSLNKAKELNNLLAPFVHRVDATELRKDLPPMQQIVLHVRQTRMQSNLYGAYKRKQSSGTGGYNNFFRQYSLLRPINNHPGSLLFPNDQQKAQKALEDGDEIFTGDTTWWQATVDKEGPDQVKGVMNGYKVVLLLHILAYAEKLGDKVLIFANCLSTLNYIEYVLSLNWSEHVPSLAAKFPGVKLGGWLKSKDYVRIDGTITGAERGDLVNQFEADDSVKAFLLSKAGGIGINLVSMCGRSRVAAVPTFSNTPGCVRLCADKRKPCGSCRQSLQPNCGFTIFVSSLSLRAEEAGILLQTAYTGHHGGACVWSLCQ
jgi:SNF2 family DNA or RNA helicase